MSTADRLRIRAAQERLVTFHLPGATVSVLGEGSPGEEVEQAVRDATARKYGGGYRYTFTVPVRVAHEMADYLWSVAGAVVDMTADERDGGGEHKAAARGVSLIEAAL